MEIEHSYGRSPFLTENIVNPLETGQISRGYSFCVAKPMRNSVKHSVHNHPAAYQGTAREGLASPAIHRRHCHPQKWGIQDDRGEKWSTLLSPKKWTPRIHHFHLLIIHGSSSAKKHTVFSHLSGEGQVLCQFLCHFCTWLAVKVQFLLAV